MYKKAPADYDCPFCKIINGDLDDKGDDRSSEIVYQDKDITAFISSHWWPNVNGPVLIIPNIHYENIFFLPDDLIAKIAILSKKIAIGMKQAYECSGVSFRQHNIAGNQSVFHYHYQVLPRSDGDNLYQNQDKKFYAEPKARLEYANKLKKHLKKI